MSESRRDFLKKSAVAGGLVWAAPVITSVTPAAAGTPPVVSCDCSGSSAFDISVQVAGPILNLDAGPFRQAPTDSGCVALTELGGLLTAATDCVNADTDGSDDECGSSARIEQLSLTLAAIGTVTADVLTADAECTCAGGCVTEACVTNLEVIVFDENLTGGPISVCDPGPVINVNVNLLGGTTITGTIAVAQTQTSPCRATALFINLVIDPLIGPSTTVTVIVASATAACA